MARIEKPKTNLPTTEKSNGSFRTITRHHLLRFEARRRREAMPQSRHYTKRCQTMRRSGYEVRLGNEVPLCGQTGQLSLAPVSPALAGGAQFWRSSCPTVLPSLGRRGKGFQCPKCILTELSGHDVDRSLRKSPSNARAEAGIPSMRRCCMDQTIVASRPYP